MQLRVRARVMISVLYMQYMRNTCIRPFGGMHVRMHVCVMTRALLRERESAHAAIMCSCVW